MGKGTAVEVSVLGDEFRKGDRLEEEEGIPSSERTAKLKLPQVSEMMKFFNEVMNAFRPLQK